MAEPYWPLGAVVAWIIWRSPEKLREFEGTEYRHPAFVAQSVGGGLGAKALRDLRHHLMNDYRLAFGNRGHCHKDGKSNVVWIEAEEWARLSIEFAPMYGHDSVGALLPDNELFTKPDGIAYQETKLRTNEFPLYLNVRIEKARVCEIWPEELKADAAMNQETLVGAPPISGKQARKVGTKEKAALIAVSALWPDGIPVGVQVQQRDDNIIKYCKTNGLAEPGYKTISRALNK